MSHMYIIVYDDMFRSVSTIFRSLNNIHLAQRYENKKKDLKLIY